jgi:iron complex transport system permease protein
MKQGYRILLLVIAILVVAVLFMLYDTGTQLDYVLSRRGIRLATITVVGVSVAFSSVIFQTITNNRILTPSIMGYESVFILFQTLIVFVYGDNTFKVISQQSNFFYAVGLMLLFSVGMYLLIFGKGKKNIFYLLLLGMVMGTLFMTLSQFMHILIDPNEFSIVQNYMFVSFAKMNTKLLTIASITLAVTIIYTQIHVDHIAAGIGFYGLGRTHYVFGNIGGQSYIRGFYDQQT